MCLRWGWRGWQGREGGVCPGSRGLSAPQRSLPGPWWGKSCISGDGWARGDLQVRSWRPWDPPTLMAQALVRTPPEAEILHSPGRSGLLGPCPRPVPTFAPVQGEGQVCEQPPVCISVSAPERPQKMPRGFILGCQRLQHGLRPTPVVSSGHGTPSLHSQPPTQGWHGVCPKLVQKGTAPVRKRCSVRFRDPFQNTGSLWGFAAPSPSLQWCWCSLPGKLGSLGFWRAGRYLKRVRGRRQAGGWRSLLLEQTFGREGSGSWQLVCDYVCVTCVSACATS